MPITDGSTPATAELTMRASTGSPSSRALSTRISRTAAAPSFSDEAFPAVTLPSAGRNAGRSWASCCSLVSGARLLIVSHESRRLFALRDADRNDLLTKAPGGDSSRRFALGAGGEGVLALAADVEGVGEVLGGNAHVVVVKGVPQAVLDHAVLQAGVAETQAVAGAMHQIGSIAHALGRRR